MTHPVGHWRPFFETYLFGYVTKLDLQISPDSHRLSMFIITIQKWTEGFKHAGSRPEKKKGLSTPSAHGYPHLHAFGMSIYMKLSLWIPWQLSGYGQSPSHHSPVTLSKKVQLDP